MASSASIIFTCASYCEAISFVADAASVGSDAGSIRHDGIPPVDDAPYVSLDFSIMRIASSSFKHTLLLGS